MHEIGHRGSEATPAVGVVLAGGSGTRLWPLSRAEAPKHLIPLLGRHSLFQETLRRLVRALPEVPPVVVGAEAQGETLAHQLDTLGLADAPLLLEPAGRNTAAAVALAAREVAARLGEACVLWVCPSDHLVRRPEVLEAAFRLALPAVREGCIATFGITPDRPETGFGWIELGDVVARGDGLALHRVARFREKPDAATARRLLAGGRHVWNSGMFVMRADVFLAELARHAPAIATAVETAHAAAARCGHVLRPPADLYARIPARPVDVAVMERSDRMVVVPCDPGWSDLGSFRALWEAAARDEAGVAAAGPVVVADGGDCLVRAESRLVAVAGVRRLAVVETADAVLVAGLEAADSIRRVVARLEAEGRPEARRPARETHSWGRRTRLHGEAALDAFARVLDPGATMPLPASPETYYLVAAGRGRLQPAAEPSRALAPGVTFAAPAGGTVCAEGPTPLVLVEVTAGDGGGSER